jgi:hypothetical protein
MSAIIAIIVVIAIIVIVDVFVAICRKDECSFGVAETYQVGCQLLMRCN